MPQEDSERLQQETREAAGAGLAFGDLRDLRPLLAAAADGIALQPFHLHAVAATLDAAAALRARVEDSQTLEGSQTPGSQHGALRALARGIGDAMPELRHEISRCIHPEEVQAHAYNYALDACQTSCDVGTKHNAEHMHATCICTMSETLKA